MYNQCELDVLPLPKVQRSPRHQRACTMKYPFSALLSCLLLTSLTACTGDEDSFCNAEKACQNSNQICDLPNNTCIPKPPEPDADVEVLQTLASLTLSANTPLLPGFEPGRLSYSVEVSVLTSEVRITPTATDPAAAITVNGATVQSGITSSDIILDLGNNEISVVVNGGEAYTITINRGAAVIEQMAYGKASNTDLGDKFGVSVSLSGDTLAVGSRGEDSSATGVGGNQNDDNLSSSGAVYIFRRNGSTWTQEAYLKAFNADAGDLFGFKVSLSENTLAVGVHAEDSNATGVDGDGDNNLSESSGAVYIFSRSGVAWSQEAYIKASNTGAGDLFGSSVSLAGDTLAVGAVGEDSNATGVGGAENDNNAGSSGAVYFFKRSGIQWSQEAYLKASNTGAGDRFGTSVSLSGDTLAVGATGEGSNATGTAGIENDNSADGSGAVYIFKKVGTTWNQEAYLKASNTELGDKFGTSVSLSENILAVGASDEDSGAIGVGGVENDNTAENSGAVYIFTRKSSNWTQEAYLKASNTGAGDLFGATLSLFRDTLAVGASDEGNNIAGLSSGAAYIFKRVGAIWTQEAHLKASNPGTDDQYGIAVSLSGENLATSAIGEDSNATGIGGDENDNSLATSGAVYILE